VEVMLTVQELRPAMVSGPAFGNHRCLDYHQLLGRT
jgi:hypothetical protein